MPIVDAQVHLWRTGVARPPHLDTPFLVEDAIRGMDETGVEAAVLHRPVSWDPDSNEQAVAAVQAYPERFAILGNPPLDKPESPALIETWKERPGMLGFRFYFGQPHNKTWPMDGTLDRLEKMTRAFKQEERVRCASDPRSHEPGACPDCPRSSCR